MKIGELLCTTEHTYLYQDEPIFPWNRIPPGTLLVLLAEENSSGSVKVLLSDGRIGWLVASVTSSPSEMFKVIS